MKSKKYILHILGVVLVIALLFGINVYILSHPEALGALEQVGLFGLFVLSVISGFNVVVPIPVSLLYPSFSALGYAPILLISIISFGMTMGDVVGFVIGKGMNQSVLETKRGKKITTLVAAHPRYITLGVFVYAMLVPLPNELIVIPLAALGIAWYRILVPILIGNIIFTMLLAFGAVQILELII